jgi:hypothetical protein
VLDPCCRGILGVVSATQCEGKGKEGKGRVEEC